MKIGQCLSASCKILYLWVKIDCYFIGDILPENYLTSNNILIADLRDIVDSICTEIFGLECRIYT